MLSQTGFWGVRRAVYGIVRNAQLKRLCVVIANELTALFVTAASVISLGVP
jgi:hypothetical protein